MVLTTDFPEYPLWALLAPPLSGVRLEHLGPDFVQQPQAPGICGVLCMTCRELDPLDPRVAFSGSDGYRLVLYPASP
jgi:hypothetical protein